jgi:hypothetical protein
LPVLPPSTINYSPDRLYRRQFLALTFFIRVFALSLEILIASALRLVLNRL